MPPTHDSSVVDSLLSALMTERSQQPPDAERVRVRVPFGRKLILNDAEFHAELLFVLRARLIHSNTPLDLTAALCSELIRDLNSPDSCLFRVSGLREAIDSTKKAGGDDNRLTSMDVHNQDFATNYLLEKLSSEADRVNELIRETNSSRRSSSYAVRNRRNHMEDFYVSIDQTIHPINKQPISLHLVVDGHAGADVALYVVRLLPYLVMNSSDLIDQFSLRTIFKQIQTRIALRQTVDALSGGCTASLVVTSDDFVYVCWLGDTAVYVVDESGGIRFRSRPHKPNRKDEFERIIRHGGLVSQTDSNGTFRINGNSAVSRSFGELLGRPVLSSESCLGDLHMQPYVSSECEIEVFRLSSASFKYVIIGTDGFSDHCSDRELLGLLRDLDSGMTSMDVCVRHLVATAQHNNSTDNICITLVDLCAGERHSTFKATAAAAITPANNNNRSASFAATDNRLEFIKHQRSSALIPGQRAIICDEASRGYASD